MSLLDKFKGLSGGGGKGGAYLRGRPVGDSPDLRRVLALPRRKRPDDAQLKIWAEYIQQELGKGDVPCQCLERYRRPCCKNILPIQAWALYEAAQCNGLLGPIGVGWGKCQGALTEIFDVASGRRRLVSESGRLSVISMVESSEQLHVRDAVAFPSGHKPCTRLTLADGASIDVSSDHPVYTHRGWVQAAEVTLSDLVAAPRFVPGPVSNLDIDDDSVKLVAYLMSDGGVSQPMASFTQMNGPVLEEALPLFERLVGGWTEIPSRSRARQFRVLGAREFREQWGVNGLAREKRLDPRFWGMSKSHCALFINRFWACDGHIGKQGAEITLASEGLIDDLRFLLLRLGVVSRKCFSPKQLKGKSFQAWRLTMYGQHALNFLEKVGPVLGKEPACRALEARLRGCARNTNNDIVPISRKEFGEICDELGWRGRGGAGGSGQRRLRTEAREFLGCTQGQYVSREKFAEFCAHYKYSGKYTRYATSDVRWERVAHTAPLPVQPVYDVSVEETHNLIANNIVVHNTMLDLLTPMVIDDCKTAVLLLPPGLKSQLVDVEWNYYGQHWKLPNLAGGRWLVPGRPTLHVVAFSELSGARATDLLERLRPDAIVVDEAHSVRNRTASRTKRFLRFFRDHPNTRLFAWSGTLVSRSIKDYAHLANLALRDGSPTPHHWPVLEAWAGHLDPGDTKCAPGLLTRFGDVPSRAYPLWVRDTPGVVSSGDSASCQASLIISERPLKVSAEVQRLLTNLEKTWQRPDGEELVDALSKSACARQLSCGFYYRWRWPRKEPTEVIERWLEVRKNWHKELREKLKTPVVHMDSPLLCARAAIRWVHGYVHIERDEDGKEISRREIPPGTKSGPLPTWKSEYWKEWEAVRKTARPETEAVWVDYALVEDAISWLKEGPGLLWYEFDGLARETFRRAGGANGPFVFAGPGDEGGRVIQGLRGAESCIASIRAHGTGRNLQQFNRNLVANPPGSGAEWEQLLGRTHRQGQLADEVTCEVYRHTAPFAAAVERARDLSEFIEGYSGTQRLATKATWKF